MVRPGLIIDRFIGKPLPEEVEYADFLYERDIKPILVELYPESKLVRLYDKLLRADRSKLNLMTLFPATHQACYSIKLATALGERFIALAELKDTMGKEDLERTYLESIEDDELVLEYHYFTKSAYSSWLATRNAFDQKFDDQKYYLGQTMSGVNEIFGFIVLTQILARLTFIIIICSLPSPLTYRFLKYIYIRKSRKCRAWVE